MSNPGLLKQGRKNMKNIIYILVFNKIIFYVKSNYFCTKKTIAMVYHCGMFGPTEITLIIVAVLLLFGGKKIPELARGIGKGIREFKKTTEDSEIASDIKDIASEFNDITKDVDKINPKKILEQNSVSVKRKK